MPSARIIAEFPKLILWHYAPSAINIAQVTGSRIKSGTRALRKGRYSSCNLIYHVTSCTHQREPVFESLVAGRILVNAMRMEETSGNSKSLAFVIMPDHLHWLMQLTSDCPLEILISKVKSRSARLINLARNETRPVWQRGYHEHAVRKEESLKAIARYIVANPLRAGIVNKIGSYPLWDSVWL